MRTLIYKRTHKGDPTAGGVFGDCMGCFRELPFDAVIGIGGIGAEAISEKIAGKLHWIGIGPRKKPYGNWRGPLVTFDHFVLYEENGPELDGIAPALARRMYSRCAPRYLFNDLDETEQAEIKHLLRRAENAPASKGSRPDRPLKHCPPRNPKRRCPGHC